MQHVLIHIDQGLGPVGAWSYSRETLTHFYPDSLDPGISGRARVLMAHRHDDIGVSEWMDYVADSEPTLADEYKTFNVDDDTIPLHQILMEFRRLWVTSSD